MKIKCLTEIYAKHFLDPVDAHSVNTAMKLLLKVYNFSTFQDNHLIFVTDPQTDHNFDRYIVKLLILFMKQLNSNLLFIQML